MTEQACTQELPLTGQQETFDSSPALTIADENSATAISNKGKLSETLTDQFFDEIQAHEDGTKSGKCLLCQTVVKQSTSSTFNYGRHIQRKHKKEMDEWKLALGNKKSDNAKKQPTLQQLFGQRSKSPST